jgi:ATP-dependent helicase/DNAse subunit B
MKVKKSKALKAKAKALARPLYTRPAAMQRYKDRTAARAEHIAVQEAAHKRNEYDRMTGHIHSAIQPGLRGALIHERSKLLK